MRPNPLAVALLALATLASGCKSSAEFSCQSCTVDTDCAGGRVCKLGICVASDEDPRRCPGAGTGSTGSTGGSGGSSGGSTGGDAGLPTICAEAHAPATPLAGVDWTAAAGNGTTTFFSVHLLTGGAPLYLASCDGGCSDPAVLTLPLSTGPVSAASGTALALDPSGSPLILGYQVALVVPSEADTHLRRCDTLSACGMDAGAWSDGLVDPRDQAGPLSVDVREGIIGVGIPDLGLTPAYAESGDGGVQDWSFVSLWDGGHPSTTFAFGPANPGAPPVRHVFSSGGYFECGDGCGSLANWASLSTPELAALVQSAKLVVDSTGGVHLAGFGADGQVRYARCSGLCLVAGSWHWSTVYAPATAASSEGLELDLRVDSSGTPTLVFPRPEDRRLLLARGSSAGTFTLGSLGRCDVNPPEPYAGRGPSLAPLAGGGWLIGFGRQLAADGSPSFTVLRAPP